MLSFIENVYLNCFYLIQKIIPIIYIFVAWVSWLIQIRLYQEKVISYIISIWLN